MSERSEIWHHAETIKCPNCGLIQEAVVPHTAPFWSYAHECACGYWITESEWETVENNTLHVQPGREAGGL